MPRWQVLAIGATCVLICFQTDSVVAEEPLLRALALGRRQRLPQPTPLTQPWGRSAVNRTDWRNNISKVTGNRCWRFFTSVADSEVERPSSFETVRFTACLELLFMELFFHRFNMTALSSCPTKNTFNGWCFFQNFYASTRAIIWKALLQNVNTKENDMLTTLQKSTELAKSCLTTFLLV